MADLGGVGRPEIFHPDRMASRILGMGDVLTLIETAQQELDQEEAQKAGERLMSGEFNLDDFLSQMQQIKRMGPLGKVFDMIPGMNKMSKDIDLSGAEGELKRVEAIIQSMTPHERKYPKIIKASRKRRIAGGSGTSVQEVNALLKQFREMQRMLKQLGKGKAGRRGVGGLDSLFGGGLRR